MLLLKYSGEDGSLLWHRRFNGLANSADVLAAAAVDARGNIAVTGYTFDGRDCDYYTAKYGPNGRLLWSRQYDGPAHALDEAAAIAIDASGNVVVTGRSGQDPEWDDDEENIRWDYYTAKYAAADGALLWEQRYNGPASHRDQARAVVTDAAGNVVVTGYSDSEVP